MSIIFSWLTLLLSRLVKGSLLTLLLMPAMPPLDLYGAEEIVIDNFESGLSRHWKVKVFKGRTLYSVHKENGNSYLEAYSKSSASGLIYNIEYDLKEYPFITWKWNIEHIISKGDATKKSGDDYAARIYVIFPHWIPMLTRSINYIWANKLKKGDMIPNPFYSRTVMVAVESGEEKSGKWIAERRNVLADYRAIFGEDPSTPGAIAIMTDTDNTGEEAVAFYDDIILLK